MKEDKQGKSIFLWLRKYKEDRSTHKERRQIGELNQGKLLYPWLKETPLG